MKVVDWVSNFLREFVLQIVLPAVVVVICGLGVMKFVLRLNPKSVDAWIWFAGGEAVASIVFLIYFWKSNNREKKEEEHNEL